MSLTQDPIPRRSIAMGPPPNYASFLAGSTTFAEFVAGFNSWGASASVSTGSWGTLQVVIDSTDVTFFRGIPCSIESWGSQEPFGDDTAVIDFPQITQFDSLGGSVSTVPWCRGGAAAQINLVAPSGGGAGSVATTTLFSGFVQSIADQYANGSGSGITPGNGSSSFLQLTLQGTMYQGAVSIVTPYFATNVTTANGTADAGQLLYNALNNAIGARWGFLELVETGFQLAVNGSFTTVLEYVQDVLGQCLKIDGTTQYTILCKKMTDPITGRFGVPVLQLKDVTTISWTVDAGAPGVDTSGLIDDVTTNTNVVYGSGTTPQGVTTPFNLELFGVATGFDPGGATFHGTKFPNFNSATNTPYPFGSASDVISLGTSDGAPGMTVTPNGVSLLQQAIGDPATGTYNTTDAAKVSNIQANAGIQVDGVVGPQTWEAIFNVASTTGGAAIVLPLAELQLPRGMMGSLVNVVDPNLRNATGAILGNNPYYDPTILRVESYIGMGAGITANQAASVAAAVVARDYAGSWAGTIILTSDPHEGSRFAIQAGDNILVNYFHGASSVIDSVSYPGILFHVNGVEVAFDSAPSMSTGIPSENPTLQVTLTVDTAARDNVTSKNYISHEPGSPGDLVRRSQTLRRKSHLTNDTVVPFDASAGAGVVPAHAIFGGLWTVLQIPMGQVGQVAKTTYATSASVNVWTPGRTGYPFYLAVFGQAVTAADMISILGSSGDPTQSGIWQTQAVALKQAGLLISWGGNNGSGLSPCGYYPSTLPQGGAVTGNFLDDGSWTYTSQNPPWAWVCEYSPNSCFIQARFEQSPGANPQ